LKLISKETEYDEVKDCTFKPNIIRTLPDDHFKEKLPVSVAGIERFLQLKDKTRRLMEEKKDREEKVFHLEKRYSSNKHESYTAPKPFALSRGTNHSIREVKLKEELKAKDARNTFRPQTNEGKNKEIIRKLIQDDY